jgi:shikimate dehydrogenase
LSPLIHCTVFRQYGVDAVYLVWETRRDELAERVKGLRSLARGFNVTIPLKEAILEHLDYVDSSAEAIGAVNTVRVEDDGGLAGYNTDYLGVMECIKQHKPRRVLLVGAGGAARAAVYALALLGAEEVVVANRSKGRAVRLAGWAKSLGVNALVVGLHDAANYAERADTVINATPLGSLACCPDEAPPVLDGVHSGQLVFDMVYKPLQTRLLREARRRGARIVDGLCMLIWQALHADKIWLGIEPTVGLYASVRSRVIGYARG